MKTAGILILIVVGSIGLGILTFNYIAMPLWVGLYQEVVTPDVRGKPAEEAKQILSKFGLKTEIQAQRFSELPEGDVVSQNPFPARRVKKGKTVKLCVSGGKENVKVPWAQGLLLSQAKNLLRSSGFEIGEVIYEHSEITKEEVIFTEPPSDSFVPKGIEVDIFVSQGITSFALPDFTWKTLTDVEDEASEFGLILEVEYVAEASPLGVIITQFPPAGTIVERGNVLSLTVGSPR